MAEPLNTTDGNKAGELRINIPSLNEISDQWLIEIETNFSSSIPKFKGIQVQIIHKINFAVISNDGEILRSTMQTRHIFLQFVRNLDDQAERMTFFQLISKFHRSAAWYTIRHCLYSERGNGESSCYVRLRLVSLNSNDSTIDRISHKFKISLLGRN